METSRTTAQCDRNDGYNLLYDRMNSIAWFPYRCICRMCRDCRTKNRTDKPGFDIVVSVVSVERKKSIGPIEFILSRTTSCICHFFCIEHLYGRFP